MTSLRGYRGIGIQRRSCCLRRVLILVAKATAVVVACCCCVITTNIATSFSWGITSGTRPSSHISSRYRHCSSVQLVPPQSQLQPQHSSEAHSIFNIRNDRRRKELSMRLTSTIANTLISSSTSTVPVLNVALDQPLYPPIKKYFFEKIFTGMLGGNIIAKSIMGFLSVLAQESNNILRMILTTITSSRMYNFVFVCTTLVLLLQYIRRNGNPIESMLAAVISPSSVSSSVTQRDVVPMPFDPTINEGWSICKLKSIVPYTGGKNYKSKATSPYLQVTMMLPQANYVLPLQIGQPIHICGLDRNGNAVQAEFYPFHPSTHHKLSTSGEFSLLVPDPSKQQLQSMNRNAPRAFEDDESNSNNDMNGNSNNNDLQQLRVIQLLQDYVATGDTEIAIHPGTMSKNKLQYRGSYYPVTEIIYVVIGSTAIVPVIDQIRTVLSSSPKRTTRTSSKPSGIERVSVVWITSSMEEFDTISHMLKEEYELHPTQLAVSCGIETNLQESSSITQEAAAEYFYNNNVEMNDTIPPFEPGMMAIVSIEGISPASAPLLRRVATTYLQHRKGFPLECTCVL